MTTWRKSAGKFLATFVLAMFLAGSQGAQGATEKTFVCPIDGMKMKVSTAVDSVKYKGKTYYFCMKGEKGKFLKSPEKYLKPKKKSEGDENKKADLTANLPDFNVDGYAFQDEVLKRIPKVIAGFTCYCGCNKTLNQCYKDHKCPPT